MMLDRCRHGKRTGCLVEDAPALLEPFNKDKDN